MSTTEFQWWADKETETMFFQRVQPNAERVTMFTVHHSPHFKENYGSAERLGSLLETCANVSWISFSATMMDDVDFENIFKCFTPKQRVYHLGFSHSRLTSVSGYVLRDLVVRDTFPCLRSLVLKNNKMDGESIASVLAALKEKGAKMDSLLFEYNCITDSGMEKISESLRGMESLIYLNLSANCIGDDGCKSLAAVIPTLPKLQFLDLDSNSIKSEGAAALASNFGNLQRLDISYNPLTQSDVHALINGFKTSSAMDDLRVDTDSRMDETTTRLAAAARATRDHASIVINPSDVALFKKLKDEDIVALYILAESCRTRRRNAMRPCHAARFTRADGDHACLHRVLGFLI